MLHGFSDSGGMVRDGARALMGASSVTGGSSGTRRDSTSEMERPDGRIPYEEEVCSDTSENWRAREGEDWVFTEFKGQAAMSTFEVGLLEANEADMGSERSVVAVKRGRLWFSSIEARCACILVSGAVSSTLCTAKSRGLGAAVAVSTVRFGRSLWISWFSSGSSPSEAPVFTAPAASSCTETTEFERLRPNAVGCMLRSCSCMFSGFLAVGVVELLSGERTPGLGVAPPDAVVD